MSVVIACVESSIRVVAAGLRLLAAGRARGRCRCRRRRARASKSYVESTSRGRRARTRGGSSRGPGRRDVGPEVRLVLAAAGAREAAGSRRTGSAGRCRRRAPGCSVREDEVVVGGRRVVEVDRDERQRRHVVAVLAVVEDDVDVVARVDVVDRDREGGAERLVGATVRGQVEHDVVAGVDLDHDVVVAAVLVLPADQLDRDRVSRGPSVGGPREPIVAVRRGRGRARSSG